jgi:hypothetical protein
MTNMTFAERCTLSEQCLPDAPYRAMLTKLHGEMLQEIERLNAEVLEQCRINGMSAEREDALRAELTRLKASIALDWMANNARDLGLDYEPAVQERNFCERCGKRLGGDGHIHTCTPPAAQPAPVQEPVAWMQDSIELYVQDRPSAHYTIPLYTTPPAAQPVPVKTYFDGKPWPVAPKPWVGLSEEEILKVYDAVESAKDLPWFLRFACAIEAKLKGKNHG